MATERGEKQNTVCLISNKKQGLAQVKDGDSQAVATGQEGAAHTPSRMTKLG